MSATCPSSFRHGQMTLTVRPASGRGSGRATIQYVRQSCVNGQMLATIPLKSVVNSGIRFGSRMRFASVTVSKPESSSTLRTSCGDTQLRIGLRGFRCRPSAARITGRQARLYD